MSYAIHKPPEGDFKPPQAADFAPYHAATQVSACGAKLGNPTALLKCRAPPLAAAIVTNPPFKHAEAMLRHAVAIGIEYLVFLHKAQWPKGTFAEISPEAIAKRMKPNTEVAAARMSIVLASAKLSRQPRNRAVRDVVAAGNLAHRLAITVTAVRVRECHWCLSRMRA